MHVSGAALDKKPGYTEDTSSSVCTQYSSADCDKYWADHIFSSSVYFHEENSQMGLEVWISYCTVLVINYFCTYIFMLILHLTGSCLPWDLQLCIVDMRVCISLNFFTGLESIVVIQILSKSGLF